MFTAVFSSRILYTQWYVADINLRLLDTQHDLSLQNHSAQSLILIYCDHAANID